MIYIFPIIICRFLFFGDGTKPYIHNDYLKTEGSSLFLTVFLDGPVMQSSILLVGLIYNGFPFSPWF